MKLVTSVKVVLHFTVGVKVNFRASINPKLAGKLLVLAGSADYLYELQKVTGRINYRIAKSLERITYPSAGNYF